jgi:hypothetical protein
MSVPLTDEERAALVELARRPFWLGAGEIDGTVCASLNKKGLVRAIWDRGHDDVSVEITEAGRDALAE